MARYGLKEVADVTFYDVTTGIPVLMFDSLKLSNLENASESVYAMGGKGNPKIVGWNFGKTVTLTMQDALISFETLGMLAGQASNTASSSYRTATINNATLVPFTLAAGGTQIARCLINNTVTNVTTTPGSISAGEWLVSSNVLTTSTTPLVTFESNKYPGYYKIVGNTLIRNEVTGSDEVFQFIINKGKLQPGFTFTLQSDGDPSTFDFNVDVFRDANTDMIKLIQFVD